MLKNQFGLSGADHLGSAFFFVSQVILTTIRSKKTPKDPIGSHEKLTCFSPQDMGHDPLKIDVVGTFVVDVNKIYTCLR